MIRPNIYRDKTPFAVVTHLLYRGPYSRPLPAIQDHGRGLETFCMLISQDGIGGNSRFGKSVVVSVDRTAFVAVQPGAVGSERDKDGAWKFVVVPE
jgi:hypothetical protein